LRYPICRFVHLWFFFSEFFGAACLLLISSLNRFVWGLPFRFNVLLMQRLKIQPTTVFSAFCSKSNFLENVIFSKLNTKAIFYSMIFFRIQCKLFVSRINMHLTFKYAERAGFRKASSELEKYSIWNETYAYYLKRQNLFTKFICAACFKPELDPLQVLL
jgi:hypothetical protein